MQDDNKQETRSIIIPRNFSEADKSTDNGPTTIRAYKTLEELNVTRLELAAAMRDNEDVVVAPIGGAVLYERTYEDGYEPGIVDEVVLVPSQEPVKGWASIMSVCQVPIMIDEKPPMLGDDSIEIDTGRFPVIDDLKESAAGQEKQDEQVLAISAEAWIRHMLNGAGTEQHFRAIDMSNTLFDNLMFVRRGWCETDERFIQLLPYVFYWKQTEVGIEIFVYQRGKETGEGRLAMACSIGGGGHINPVDFFSTQTFAEVSGLDSEVKIHNRRGPRMLAESFWSGITNNVLRENDEEFLITDGGGKSVDLLDIIDASIAKETSGNHPLSHEQWMQRRTSFFLDYKAGAVERVHLGMFIGIEVPADYDIKTREDVLHDVGFRKLDDLYADNDELNLPTRLESWSRSIVNSLYETIDFMKENKTDTRSFSTRFLNDQAMRTGTHPADASMIEKIPPQDRWKIGTISGSLSHKYRLYALNAFIRA